MTQNEAWESIKEHLQAAMSVTSYNTWVRTLSLMAVYDNKVVMGSTDLTAIQVLKTRYLATIAEAVREAYGRGFEVVIVNSNEPLPAAMEQEKSKSTAMESLNPKYTFDTFVVGESNRFAHAASLAVAELPSEAYNPLFLYGGVGLGKTHLMHAIGHYVLGENPGCKLMYITSETFTNEVITAINKRTNQQLRDRLRNVDILMIDDIQFIAGKTSTQEEFFHTFNHLHSGGKQIIISSDRPPKDIPTLEERLRSRFEWGLIADIQKPDYETRVAILRRKAASEFIDVPDEVLNFIAEKVESNIRELEGSLIRVNAKATVKNVPITLTLAQEALFNLVSVRDPKRITPDLIMQVVADYYRIEKYDLTSQRRNREIALPRQMAMYLTREMTSLSTTRIGDVFGGRDHTTVMHACDKIAKSIESSPSVGKTLDDLRTIVKEK